MLFNYHIFREVIERKPEEFKIACLSDLMSLFPSRHPFYAGFGNRETDIKSYVAVGIPTEQILIIDPTGNVKNAAYDGFKTNYDMMLKDRVVDYFFPPLNSSQNKETDRRYFLGIFTIIPYFSSSFNYWREQPVEIDDAEMETYEKNRRQKQLEEIKRRKQLIGRIRYVSV
jgi:phosphatidate phosphatase LPIN